MGKIFGKSISKLSFCILIACALLSEVTAQTSDRELQLFDHAYHAYLSYQPERAIEQFRLFLAEFPDSSANDAALFWLAKSLLQIQSTKEAKQIFADIKLKFPESPFVRYAAKEIEAIEKVKDEQSPVTVLREAPAEQKPPDADKIQETCEEKMEKTGVLQRKLRELEQREKYIINSAVVLDRIGIHDVLWRTNDIIEDVENEQILYELATNFDITADSTQRRTLIETHKLNAEQADYLNRYLVICEFLSIVMSDMAGERIVETLTTDAKKALLNKGARTDLFKIGSELQTHARNGMSLEDIHALYPDSTKFARVRMQELKGGMKEKISFFQNDETGVFWTEDEFMIIRLISPALPCNPLAYKQSGEKNKMRLVVRELVEERRKEQNAAAIQKGK